MTELERIQSDLEKGYTVTRYGTTEALHEQMLNDIKYLNELANNNEVLGDVSKRPVSKKCANCKHLMKDGEDYHCLKYLSGANVTTPEEQVCDNGFEPVVC